jgi:hypothetical protein
LRDIERVLIRVFGEFFGLGLRLPPLFPGSDYLLAAFLELVGEPTQKEHAKYIDLELRGIHVSPEDVCGGEEVRFELLKREFFRGCTLPKFPVVVAGLLLEISSFTEDTIIHWLQEVFYTGV